MPPKKGAKQDQKAAAAVNHDLESAEQDPLQAVILADSFNRRFDVLCVDQPRVSPLILRVYFMTIDRHLVSAPHARRTLACLDFGKLEPVQYYRSGYLLYGPCRCYQRLRSVSLTLLLIGNLR
jgi:hypothetical protein